MASLYIDRIKYTCVVITDWVGWLSMVDEKVISEYLANFSQRQHTYEALINYGSESVVSEYNNSTHLNTNEKSRTNEYSITDKMNTIFISYARENQKIVLSIYNLLRNHGFSPWIDVVDLIPGQNWEQETEKAIRNCRFFLACLSTHSVSKRGYVQAEFKKAFKILEMIPEEDVFLIPIRLDDCKIPFSFSSIHVLDYFVDNGRQRLIETFNICQGFGKDSTLLLEEFAIDSHNAEVLAEIAKKSSMHDKAIALLEEALKVRQDPSERYWIYATLGKIGGKQAMRILENGLNEVNEFSKQGAKDAIELILQKISDQ